MDSRELIQKSIDYIEENLKGELTAGELAEDVGFSIFHYYRLFQSAVGMSIMQYITRRKLMYALYEISCGRKMIDAALEYGFDTYAGFYRACRRELGSTPSAFLRSHKVKKPYKINLLQEEHIMITHKKAAEVLKHWNLEQALVSDIYYQGSGNKNDNALYVGEKYVLKFTANLGKLKNHHEISQRLASVGLQSAVLVKTVDGQDYVEEDSLYFYLTHRLEGEQILADTMYEGDYPAKARFVGEMIGQLHLALKDAEVPVKSVDLYEKTVMWALPKAKNIMGLAEDFCREYIRTFDSLHGQLPRQIIHRDPNPGNIICSQDQWGFIDFELSEENVRIFDPCYAATAILSESFAQKDEEKLAKWIQIYKNIMAGYDSVVGLEEAERQAIPYVLLANQLICVAWFAEQDKYKEIFAVNKKMTRWMVERLGELKVETGPEIG